MLNGTCILLSPKPIRLRGYRVLASGTMQFSIIQVRHHDQTDHENGGGPKDRRHDLAKEFSLSPDLMDYVQ